MKTSGDWYLLLLADVQKSSWKYPDWKVEFGVLYHKKHEDLLDPVTNDEYCWRLVITKEQQIYRSVIASLQVVILE